MNDLPDLSIVIVSYQVRELLDRCLASLVSVAKPHLEIWVVDNASSDDSADWVRAHFPGVHLIANRENRGFSAANNQALSPATGRYVMLLNPDTELPRKEPNALELLVDFMDRNPRAGACGPRLFYGDGAPQHSAFHFPSLAQVYLDLFPTNWRLTNSGLNGRYPRRLFDGGRPFLIDHPLGAAFLVRRETAAQVGWLDEAFFIYVEEVDWARRIRGAGWEIWCVPQAEIIHHEAQSTRQFRDRMFVELWRARFHFFQKHYSPVFNGVAGLIVRAGMQRAISRARQSRARGEIAESELDKQLVAYCRVVEITKHH
ncbi:MAG: glycosyltransferase family 2 protein [Anaerolineae bacterium]